MISPDPEVIAMAVLLDLVLGDPRWLPHPVVQIGRLITVLESLLRRLIACERCAGVLLLLLTTGTAAGTTWLLLRSTAHLSSLAGLLAAIMVSATCLAARSLHRESSLVAAALGAGDIISARQHLSYIVGRDTEHLNEDEIWRALVETVAENTSDGIIAPLFWLSSGGPVTAMAFKAISTLDSMVGYKNERYLQFGWASARMDDLVNFIPARLTAILMIISAPALGLSWSNACKIFLRDRLKHPSPNSAHPEAAAAGALGVRLGGTSSYGGKESFKQHIGDPLTPLDGQAYRNMIRLMYLTTLLMAGLCIVALMACRR
ncbi:adenosylcobinamide-phosphate synthase CbiB [Pelotalea chapellei]|uniref:Cobalamin biosynthesis protein CobD n=1 Tax=Pelotalea chapellei TaxID=44671 RepID=A0ABS5U9Y1_9BACT|nr:adenosylcobinamide-phosphate synthase CbiB [Pelotalea chapellei]MBT1072464.1 cobalamin biosynthesis protein CobD [Pelotalea chapellei]